jgi:hypothetical protein
MLKAAKRKPGSLGRVCREKPIKTNLTITTFALRHNYNAIVYANIVKKS